MNRRDNGKAIINKLFGGFQEEERPCFKDMSGLTTDYLFGELWSREALSTRDRSLITVAVLCATGKEPQLKVHLKGALNQDITPDQLKEVMMHIAHYSGWPAGMNGLAVLNSVVEEMGLSFS
jgi:4-carboxymuconolactone decarboxylase